MKIRINMELILLCSLVSLTVLPSSTVAFLKRSISEEPWVPFPHSCLLLSLHLLLAGPPSSLPPPISCSRHPSSASWLLSFLISLLPSWLDLLRHAQLLSHVQLFLSPWSPWGSSVRGILQTRIPELLLVMTFFLIDDFRCTLLLFFPLSNLQFAGAIEPRPL